ncbi:MAG: MBL fold metallo-hydrolase [Candidatus Saliniplasma sp.]
MTDHLRSSQRSMVEIKRIPGKAFSSNVYIVRSQKNFIVDAGAGPVKRIYDYVDSEGLEIDRIILTHRHFDHVGGAEKLSDMLDVPIYAHELAAKALREGDDRTIISNSFGKEVSGVDVKVLEEDTYAGFLKIHTPGHTNCSICLYHGGDKILISGDTVFSGGGVGRSDLPTGDFEELKNSVEKLTRYDVYSLYPGHGPSIKQEGNEHIRLSLQNMSYL